VCWHVYISFFRLPFELVRVLTEALYGNWCSDYERAECNCALGIGAILDKNMDIMDDVY
jgi:hypothetical protein